MIGSTGDADAAAWLDAVREALDCASATSTSRPDDAAARECR